MATRSSLLCLLTVPGLAAAQAVGAVVTTARAAGKSLPGPHNSRFEPIPEPSLRTGVTAMSSVAIALLQK